MEAFDENTFVQIVNPGRAVILLMFGSRLGEPEDNYLRAKENVPAEGKSINKIFERVTTCLNMLL